MEILVCKRCKRMFQYVAGKKLCVNCKKKEDEIFFEVNEYLRENRGATIEMVSEATGASVALIEEFIREGRLEIAPDSAIIIKCKKCGKRVFSGTICEECRKEQIRQLQAAMEIREKNEKNKENSKPNISMHTRK